MLQTAQREQERHCLVPKRLLIIIITSLLPLLLLLLPPLPQPPPPTPLPQKNDHKVWSVWVCRLFAAVIMENSITVDILLLQKQKQKCDPETYLKT